MADETSQPEPADEGPAAAMAEAGAGSQPLAATAERTDAHGSVVGAPLAVGGESPRRLPVIQPGAQLTAQPTGNVLGQAWLVLVLAMAFGSGLAGVEYLLGPRIAQNKLDETLSQVPELVPGAVRGEPDEATVPGKRVFRAFDGDGKLVGWVVPGSGAGFADKVELIIGLDAQASELTGLFVLDQKETPGLGDAITGVEFRSRFVGFSTGVELDARQAPTNRATGVVQALTGATISSDTVCTIINRTVALVEKPLAAAAAAAGANRGGE